MGKVLDVISGALLLITLPGAVGFPIWYHLRMRWRASEMGRHVMAYSVVVALAYISGIIRVFFQSHIVDDVVRVLISTGMCTVVWWRVLVFVHVRRRVMAERNVPVMEEKEPILDEPLDRAAGT